MDYQQLSQEFLRALRGARSQTAFSRRLGYSTNVAYGWESGRRAPNTSEVLRAAARIRLDVAGAFERFFHPRPPPELSDYEATSPAYVAAVLRAMRGTNSMQSIADRVGLSRPAVSRILSGKTEVRLPLFFQLVDSMTRRLLDLMSDFVDVSQLPAAGEEWQRIEAVRHPASQNPLSDAVSRFLELDEYAAQAGHIPGWIAERMGISQEDEERTLQDLELAGIIRWDGSHWRLEKQRSIDTTRNPELGRRMLEYWTERSRARIASAGDGRFSYLVFGCDDATLTAINDLRLRFYREMRALVAAAPTASRVMVATVHLYPLDVGTGDTNT
ncbi:MAG: DUF4423 domain-containing protein [Myxococcales bacterium]|nr:DUF4423 domain-containing protein [Myxococcales bacterium]